MISNRVKRNIWGAMTVVGIGIITGKAIDVATGGEWWHLLSAIVIFATSARIFISYRKAVKEGNLFGKVSPFGR